jgi:hypothetical protein
MKRTRTLFNAGMDLDPSAFELEYGTAVPRAKFPNVYTDQLARLFLPSASPLAAVAAGTGKLDSPGKPGIASFPFGLRERGGCQTNVVAPAAPALGDSVMDGQSMADVAVHSSSAAGDSLPSSSISQVGFLRRVLRAVLPGPALHLLSGATKSAAVYPMHTWILSSRLLVCSAPRMYVAVLDSFSLFAIHLSEFSVPLEYLYPLLPYLGYAADSVPLRPVDVPPLSTCVEYMSSSVLDAQRLCLGAALETMDEFVRSISSASHMPSQPQNVVKDGLEPQSIDRFWEHFIEHFSSILFASVASKPAPPSFYRSISSDVRLPLLNLSLESPKPSDSMVDVESDDRLLRDAFSCLPQAALISQKLLDMFLAQWNVRAEKPALNEGMTPAEEAASARSSPRLRLLTFYTR